MPPVGARLSAYVPIWSEITRDKSVLNDISGITLDFIEDPMSVPSYKVAFQSSGGHENFQAELAKLLNKKVVEPCNPVSDQVLSKIFLIPKPDGSFRTIFDMKPLNEVICYVHFKMDTLQTALSLMRKDWFMASVDLKDAYFSLPVADEFRKYLRFQYGSDIYQFRAMPQGLCSAPRIFTKIMKPVMAVLRKQGVVAMNYLDDLFITAPSVEECLKAIEDTMSLLRKLGFLLNLEKSHLTPTKALVFLGYCLHSDTMTVTLPQDKVEKIQQACSSLLTSSTTTAQQVAQTVGLMIAYSNASDHGLLHYRHLESQKTQALQDYPGDYSAQLTLSDESKQELQWWLDNASLTYLTILHGNASYVIHSDASQSGWGAFCVTAKKRTSGSWSEIEKTWSINAKELKAALLGLRALGPHLSNTHVQLRSDNTTTVAYINNMGGSRAPLCDSIARELWAWAVERSLWLSSTHIPGRLNIEADAESRLKKDDKEWELNDEVFNSLVQLWGVPDIDLFASRLNFKVPRYVAWKPDPGACHVDAFTLSWCDTFSYAFPPFSVIGRVLQKLTEDQSRMILIVPDWATTPWFSILPSMMIDHPVRLPRMQRLLRRGQDLHPLRHQLKLIACLLSGNPSHSAGFRQQLKGLSWRPGVRVRKGNMMCMFANGPPFVQGNISIPYLRL